MTVTENQFYTDLYEEHLFETGSLLNTRPSYLIDSEISWLDLHDLEQRIIPHENAIKFGGRIAADCLVAFIASDDEDEFSGATYAFCANIDEHEFYNTLNLQKLLLSEDNKNKLAEIIQILKFVRGNELTDFLLTLVNNDLPLIQCVAIETLGYRGNADPRRIWPLFHDKDESVKTAAMVAVMRLGFKKAIPAMEQAVLENKEMFNEHRLFPLLMLGSNKALEFSRRACQSSSFIKPQYPIYLALGGKEEDFIHILKAMEFDNMNAAVLEAIGIFGSLKGLNTLMKFISSKDDEEKLTAAKSLNQISGAQLYETLTVIEKEDDDIDAEDITGKPAASNEEKKSGDERTIEIKQDCTDKERWTQWWQENKGRFDPSIRYRHGKPYSFFLVLEEIAHPQSKFEDRQRAYNELVMRSGHHIPFEPDWFVDKQIQALKKWQVWWNDNKSSYTNQWMFDGK